MVLSPVGTLTFGYQRPVAPSVPAPAPPSANRRQILGKTYSFPLFGNLKTPPEPKRIVVVGNGLGGVAVARKLDKLLRNRPGMAEVTVIGKHPHFLFKPMLPDALNETEALIPMEQVTRPGGPVSFKQASVTGVDLNAQTVRTDDKATLPYDYLVLAPGARTNTFNTPGADQYALHLEDHHDLLRIRNLVKEKLMRASSANPNSQEQAENLSFVVVGGGATGIELAFELSHLIHNRAKKEFANLRFRPPNITVIEAFDDILPGFSEREKTLVKQKLKTAKVELLTNTGVSEVKPDGSLVVKDKKAGRTYTLHTTFPVWVTGVKAGPLNDKIDSEKAGRNQLKVNPFLELPKHTNVYAIGDAAFAIDPTTDPNNPRPYPTLGQVAQQQGDYVAQDIVAKLRQSNEVSPNRKPFAFKTKGMMLSLGPDSGFIRLFDKYLMHGRIAAWVRKYVYHDKMKNG